MVASSSRCATPRSQYSGSTVSGPKNPNDPQRVTTFDPIRRPPSRAAITLTWRRAPARRHEIAVAHEVERIGQSQKRSERQPDNPVRLFEFTLFERTNLDELNFRHA